MKKLFYTLIAIFTFWGCFGQRYEAWVRTSENHRLIRGNYGFSNDSILMIYSNPSLVYPLRDTYFTWDDVTDLRVRNKSRNLMGQMIGASVGFLATYLVIEKSGSIDSRELRLDELSVQLQMHPQISPSARLSRYSSTLFFSASVPLQLRQTGKNTS